MPPPTSFTLPVPAQVPCRRGAEGGRLQQAVSRGGARAQVRTPQLHIPHRGGVSVRGRCWWHPWHGAPTRAQTGRESQVLSVRGESIPEERFCQSLCRAVGMWPGARLIDYVCVESSLLGESPPKCPTGHPKMLPAPPKPGWGLRVALTCSWHRCRRLLGGLRPPLRGVRGAAGPEGPVGGAALQGKGGARGFGGSAGCRQL